MCGILGVFGEIKEDTTQYNSILHTLQHRGPDDCGMVKGVDHILGHHRLSIMDIEKGHQPLQAPNGRVSMVCNGEIYNFNELRENLAERYPFSTHSDSEVILPIFQNENHKVAEHLDGMFSFIISGPDSYYVARDPIGIKPLYYGSDGDRLYFASEVKALTRVAERIEEFPKGHFIHSETGFRPYYHLPEIDEFITDIDTAIVEIQQTLRKSVQKRLMSDAPVGVFLSGGLDSSIIAALMKEQLDELHSFSVGFQDAPDLKAARTVADHLGTIHHEYVYSEAEMTKVLPKVIYHLESYDASLVRSAIPCYFVSRLASQFVKVILSGEGADELFAGYSYLHDCDDPKSLQRESIRILNGLHNINLQRVDRMTMAHALEGRVPFLDIEFIESVLSIEPRLKMYRTFGIEKWLLRKAFEDLLPREIVWRDKMEFAQGCGSSEVFEKKFDALTGPELQVEDALSPPLHPPHWGGKRGGGVRGEEQLYYDLFKRFFDHPDAENLIGKWQGNLH